MSRILLLLVALIAGGLAAYLATRGGDVPTGPSGPTSPEIVEEARVKVLVAAAPVGVGERLSQTNMVWVDWPQNAVREDYIKQADVPEAMTDMQGAVARFEIFEGDPIRPQKLVRSDQGYLSAVLDKGMRGVSIPVQADSASGGFIVPNDHVDVILTRGGGESGQTETILTNVRVLAINTRLGEVGATGAPEDPANPRAEIFDGSAIATLELDPAQAETVINARQMGQLSLALRSIVDFAQTTEDAVRRNAPIKIIRYGVEANVMTGTTASSSSGDVTVDPASYAEPPIRGPISPEPEGVLE
ncbi:MAG: Flp pilus assembly protein CpaB [Devosia sp.]